MGSPFSSRTVVTLPIPFDPGQEVTIQKLAGRHLEKAELAAQAKFIESVEARGGFDAQKKMLKLYEDGKPKGEPESKPDTDEKPANPLAGLDPYTVCRFGIKSWSYDESLKEAPVEDETFDVFTQLKDELMRKIDDLLTKPSPLASFKDSITATIIAMFKVTPPVMRVKSIDDMGPDEQEWFATEIMRITKPRLFQTKAEHKETEKNDSAPSPTA